MSVDGKSLAQRCLLFRAEHNLSQVEMAKLCRVHQLTIHNCESGKPMRRMTAAKIVAVIEKEE